jgi:hypothetical protein
MYGRPGFIQRVLSGVRTRAEAVQVARENGWL